MSENAPGSRLPVEYVSVGLGLIAPMIGSLAGAGWPGLLALAGVGLSLPIGLSALVRYINTWADHRDQERAGTDAGTTASDLQGQGRAVATGLDAIQTADPPTEGYPK